MIPLMDTVPARRTPWVTYALIAINVAVFLYEISLPHQQLTAFFRQWGVVPRYLLGAEGSPPYHTLITHMFLHGGWGHLIANMWALWIFGDNVEDRMGPIRFLGFYLLAGVGAALIHSLLHASTTVPSIGASGAISGVMGAYLIMFPYSRIVTILPLFFMAYLIELPAYYYIGLWFVGQLMAGVMSLALPGTTGIAFWAHVGGFLVGAGMVRLWDRRFVREYYRNFVVPRRYVKF